MKTNLARVGLLLGAAFILGTLSPPVSAQPTYVNPYTNVFSPNGSSSRPWTLLNSAASASAGGTVEILGGQNVYGANRIDKPTRLTRNSGNGTVKIGAAPVGSTTFRCISYNAWLYPPGWPVPSFDARNWADDLRAQYISTYDWGNWDFFGICELWNEGLWPMEDICEAWGRIKSTV